MPTPRINMRKLKDALRLKLVGEQSHQQIATALGIAKGSVTKYCALAATVGLDWSAIDAMSETDLEHRLFGSSKACTFARPDYGRMHQELRRKGVTVMLPPGVRLVVASNSSMANCPATTFHDQNTAFTSLP